MVRIILLEALLPRSYRGVHLLCNILLHLYISVWLAALVNNQKTKTNKMFFSREEEQS